MLHVLLFVVWEFNRNSVHFINMYLAKSAMSHHTLKVREVRHRRIDTIDNIPVLTVNSVNSESIVPLLTLLTLLAPPAENRKKSPKMRFFVHKSFYYYDVTFRNFGQIFPRGHSGHSQNRHKNGEKMGNMTDTYSQNY